MDCYKPTPLFTMGGSRLQTCVILHGRWIIWDVRFCWKPRGMADPLVFSLMYVHPSLPSPRTLFFVPFRLCAILWLQSFSNRCCSILPFLEDPCVTPNEGKLVFFSVPLPSQLVRWSRLSQLLMVFCLGSYWPSKVSLQQNHIMLQMKRWLQNNLILIEFNIYNKKNHRMSFTSSLNLLSLSIGPPLTFPGSCIFKHSMVSDNKNFYEKGGISCPCVPNPVFFAFHLCTTCRFFLPTDAFLAFRFLTWWF